VWYRTLRWLLDAPGQLDRWQESYGDIFEAKIAGLPPVTLIGEPSLAASMLANTRTRAGAPNRFMEAVLGERSVICIDDEEHLNRRRRLIRALTGEALGNTKARQSDLIDRHLNSWPSEGELSLDTRVQALAFELVVDLLVGGSPLEAREGLGKALGHLWGIVDLPRPAMLLAYLAARGVSPPIDPGRASPLRPLYKRRHRAYEAIRTEIHRRTEGGQSADDDLLGWLLLSAGRDSIPERDICHDVVALMAAGHDTCATVLSWAVHYLTHHPEVLERVREDLLNDEKGTLEAVISETLRLCPPVMLTLRELTADTTAGPYELSAGTYVAPCIYLANRHPSRFREPARFDPTRFLGEGESDHLSYGGGIRRCVGAHFAHAELVAVLSKICLQFSFRPVSEEMERRAPRALIFGVGRPARGGRVHVLRHTGDGVAGSRRPA
jgi:cytochrome P450